LVEVGYSQLQTEDSFPVCGSPFLPSDEIVDNYFSNLQKNNPSLFKTFTQSAKADFFIGEERTFNVLNLVDRTKVKFDQVTATLRDTKKGVNIWVDNSEWENGHVTIQVVQNILDGLTETTPLESIEPGKGIVEIEHQVFGMAPDIDNNGTIEFLLTDIQDGWEETGGFIGGFFYPRDQQPQTPGSNKADILYIDTYPGIYQSDGESGSFEYRSALSTVAHEYQHLLQFNNDEDEETFVDEGLSEIASFLCGYGLRDPSAYLFSTNLSLVEFTGDDFDVSLNHYAKVALFTFFLYERCGLGFISDLSVNDNQGISGINETLNQNKISQDFSDVVLDFFLTISINNPLTDPEYSFLRGELQYLTTQPLKRITSFPESKALSIKPYSLHMVEITNAASLSLEQDGSYSGPLYSSIRSSDEQSPLEDGFLLPYENSVFGELNNTLYLYYMNNGSAASNIILSADGNSKSYLFPVYDGGEEPGFLISSSGNTNAAQFQVPFDSTYLKSIRFYNGSSSGDIFLHLYQEPINGKIQPQSEIIVLKNVLHNAWNQIDVSEISTLKDQSQVFEIGIEYRNKGSMGYHENQAADTRSFLRAGSNVFRYLDQFQITGGSELDGVWMISAEMAAPARYEPATGKEGTLTWAGVGPNPFNPAEQNEINIAYNYSGSNQLRLNIFNIRGEKVYSIVDNRLAGLIYWDGKNRQGKNLASGFYFLQLKSNQQAIHKTVILLH